MPLKEWFVLNLKTQALPIDGVNCRVTICSPSPKEMRYEPNKPNTINLQRVDERAGLLANWTTASKDLKYEQA